MHVSLAIVFFPIPIVKQEQNQSGFTRDRQQYAFSLAPGRCHFSYFMLQYSAKDLDSLDILMNVTLVH